MKTKYIIHTNDEASASSMVPAYGLRPNEWVLYDTNRRHPYPPYWIHLYPLDRYEQYQEMRDEIEARRELEAKQRELGK